uniref:PTS glucose transporter subunit IIA n=1 Tax=Enterocloster clostridioformis TaxID=1531 RepID=UPI001F3C71B6|nr:PTS glucose transporter subunit IIA [Enterocloster clostridioformis]
MNEIPDEVFSTGVLGVCCGIDPSEGKVYAPVDGKISQLADTLHAVGIEVGDVSILIHVGVDTVEMNGKGFTSAVKLGQAVKKRPAAAEHVPEKDCCCRSPSHGNYCRDQYRRFRCGGGGSLRCPGARRGYAAGGKMMVVCVQNN